jgi:catalase (peroxidase I)
MAAGMPRLLAFALAALLTYGASADVDIVDLKSKSQKTLLSQARRRLTEWSPCPGLFAGTPKSTFERVPSHEEYLAALEKLDLEAVKKDVSKLVDSSHPCWPADDGSYGGLFVRLSWHASGTFRNTDNVGGAGGGRQRFNHEASWEDNTNLDKARALVAPIKEKYGDGLSWADLIVLVGTQAMWTMGTPVKEFCFGRVDDPDGYRSQALGASDEQRILAPCAGPVNGRCQEHPNATALAPTTVGLIYVNPEGPLGNPDPKKSVEEIRITFEKMGHGDRSTVALIGGGHAFGKTHGACSDKEYPEPAGLPPKAAYKQNTYPYIGKCPAVEGGITGTGKSTWTSGFEGPWTSTPARWSNEFFRGLLDEEWEVWEGPGGHKQWRMKNQPSDPRMRLTSDIALLHDPEYKKYVELFASNMTAFDEAFDEAWTQLITNGGGWSSKKRCASYGPPPDYQAAPPPAMLNTDPDGR